MEAVGNTFGSDGSSRNVSGSRGGAANISPQQRELLGQLQDCAHRLTADEWMLIDSIVQQRSVPDQLTVPARLHLSDGADTETAVQQLRAHRTQFAKVLNHVDGIIELARKKFGSLILFVERDERGNLTQIPCLSRNICSTGRLEDPLQILFGDFEYSRGRIPPLQTDSLEVLLTARDWRRLPGEEVEHIMTIKTGAHQNSYSLNNPPDHVEIARFSLEPKYKDPGVLDIKWRRENVDSETWSRMNLLLHQRGKTEGLSIPLDCHRNNFISTLQFTAMRGVLSPLAIFDLCLESLADAGKKKKPLFGPPSPVVERIDADLGEEYGSFAEINLLSEQFARLNTLYSGYFKPLNLSIGAAEWSARVGSVMEPTLHEGSYSSYELTQALKKHSFQPRDIAQEPRAFRDFYEAVHRLAESWGTLDRDGQRTQSANILDQFDYQLIASTLTD